MSENLSISRELVRRTAPVLMAGGLVLGACSTQEIPEVSPQADESIVESDAIIIDGKVDKYSAPNMAISTSLLGVDSFEALDLFDSYESVENQGQEDRYLPIISVSLKDGKITAEDVSPLGMGEGAVQWFADRMSAHEPILRAAFKSGKMDSVIIALDDDQYDESERPRDTGYVHGYFNPDAKSTVYEVSTHANILNAEVLEQYMVHESMHVLFASNALSYFSEGVAEPALIETFQVACMNLRSIAAKDINSNMYSTARDLKFMADNQVDPAMFARYNALYEVVNGFRWKDVQPTIKAPELQEKVPACYNPRLGQMAASLAEALNLPPINPELKTPIESPAYDSYDQAQSIYDDLMKTSSTYRVVNEAHYLYSAPDMGHPHNGLDELVASTMNVMISFPDEFALKVKYLAPEQRQAIIDVVRLVNDQIISTNPDLGEYLTDIEAEFLTAVNQ